MERSYITILGAFLLFCCLCNLTISDSSRDQYSVRLESSKSFGCSTTANATTSFKNNLNLLLSDFAVRSSQTSFYNTSIGDSPDRVYGYYMCRGDTTQQFCNSCIINGTEFATDANCEHVDGIFYAEKCMFRYSNRSMYGLSEQASLSVFDYVRGNVSNYQQFNQTLSSTIEAVISEAAFSNGSVLGFATREGSVTGDETIYSLAQCTPDIVGTNCSRCLQSALSSLKRWADGAPGAFSTTSKCQLRYDNVPFYDLRELQPSKGKGLRPLNHLIVYSAVLLLTYYSYAVLY